MMRAKAMIGVVSLIFVVAGCATTSQSEEPAVYDIGRLTEEFALMTGNDLENVKSSLEGKPGTYTWTNKHDIHWSVETKHPVTEKQQWCQPFTISSSTTKGGQNYKVCLEEGIWKLQ